MARIATVTAAAIIIAAASSRNVLATPPTADPAPSDLESRTAALQSRIDQLERADPLSARRELEIRQLVKDVLADADTRTSMRQEDAKVEYDDGFTIKSRDSGLRLRINGQMQLRYSMNHQRNSIEDDWRDGFENRRTKLIFSGRLADSDWRFKMQMAMAREGGGATIESAWIRRKFNDAWSMRAGQFKLPLLRERLVSSRNQLLVDRSLVAGTFNQGFSQGVELSFESDAWRADVAVSDGLRNDDSPWSDRDTEIAATGRVEALLAGDWDIFSDFTSRPDSEGGLMLGAAIHYELDEYGTDNVEDELIRWTADVSWELGGGTLFFAVVGDHSNPGDAPRDDLWGWVVQGGVYVADDLELFARYEFGDGGADEEDLSVVTLGVNKYIAGRQIKLTADVGYGFDRVDSLWDRDSLGWREDEAGKAGQVVLRSQIQLLF